MCTSLTIQTTAGDQFLARTMDFAFELGGRPVAIPRNHILTVLPMRTVLIARIALLERAVT